MSESTTNQTSESAAAEFHQLLEITDIALPLAAVSVILAVTLVFWSDWLTEVVFRQYANGSLKWWVTPIALVVQAVAYLVAGRRPDFPDAVLLVVYTAGGCIFALSGRLVEEPVTSHKAKIALLGHSYFLSIFVCLSSRLMLVLMQVASERLLRNIQDRKIEKSIRS